MKKHFLIIILIALVGLSSIPAFSQATDVLKNNVIIPFARVIFNPCACDGVGEFIEFTGSIHKMLYIKIDNNGIWHWKFHNHPIGVKGIGLTTGDIYNVNGGMSSITKTTPDMLPINMNYIDKTKIIGPGPDNNYSMYIHEHMTMNANGEITVEFSDIRIECH